MSDLAWPASARESLKKLNHEQNHTIYKGAFDWQKRRDWTGTARENDPAREATASLIEAAPRTKELDMIRRRSNKSIDR